VARRRGHAPHAAVSGANAAQSARKRPAA
jgi:hypothetical protein